MTKSEFNEIISFFIKKGEKIEYDFKKLNELYAKENKKTPSHKVFLFLSVIASILTLYAVFNNNNLPDNTSVVELFILCGVLFPVIVGSIGTGIYKVVEGVISKIFTNQNYSIVGSLLRKNKIDHSNKLKNIKKHIKNSKNTLLSFKFFKSLNFSGDYKSYISSFYYRRNDQRLDEIIRVYREDNNKTYLSDLADILLEHDSIDSESKNIVINILKLGYQEECEKLEEKRIIADLSTSNNKSDILSSIDEKIKANKNKSAIVLSL